MKYPNRKIVWAIIAAIIIVGGAFAVDQYSNVLPAKTAYSSPTVSAPPTNTSTSIASNDWQKVLVGAGIGNMAKNSSLNSGVASINSKPLTATDKLGEVLVSKYLQLQQSGATQNADTVNTMVSDALSNPNIIPTTKVYDFSNIKIGTDDSTTATLTYGQKLGDLFKNNNNAVGNEAVYARDSEEQNDLSVLANIDPLITSYKNILTGLLNTVSPPSLAKIHLDLINAMSERLSTAELLRVINTDPAAGLEGAGQYTRSIQDLFNAFTELKQYFATRGINFGTTTTSALPGINGQ